MRTSSAGPRGRCGGRLPVDKQSHTGAEPDEEGREDEGDRLVTPPHKEPGPTGQRSRILELGRVRTTLAASGEERAATPTEQKKTRSLGL
jgi:hypothetical protein